MVTPVHQGHRGESHGNGVWCYGYRCRGPRLPACLHCGWDGDADVVAGMNLLAGIDDPDIHLWTPKERVKGILDERFRRRKETGNPVRPVDRRNGTPLPAGLQSSREGAFVH